MPFVTSFFSAERELEKLNQNDAHTSNEKVRQEESEPQPEDVPESLTPSNKYKIVIEEKSPEAEKDPFTLGEKSIIKKLVF